MFTTRLGTTFNPENLRRSLVRALARAGVRHIRFHDLRHTYATLMLEAGEDLAVVSKSLGHSTIGITADLYTHMTPTMGDRAAARMDGILARRAVG